VTFHEEATPANPVLGQGSNFFVDLSYFFNLFFHRSPPCPSWSSTLTSSLRVLRTCEYFLKVWTPLWFSGQSYSLQSGDVLCFLWGCNRIYVCYVEESRPPLRSSGQSSWLHNGDVLCFLLGTNSIYICYVEESRPPLWSSGQSSWLQIQRFGFDSRRYQISCEVVGLERGPLSIIDELVGIKSSGSGLETREYGRRDPSRWPRDTLYPQKSALTSSTSSGRLIGIVRSRTKATEFLSLDYSLSAFWVHPHARWSGCLRLWMFVRALLSSVRIKVLTMSWSLYKVSCHLFGWNFWYSYRVEDIKAPQRIRNSLRRGYKSWSDCQGSPNML
jgi:hypothetical protein